MWHPAAVVGRAVPPLSEAACTGESAGDGQ